MDFTPTQAQQDLGALARDILGDHCTQERLRQVEAENVRFDPDLWAELAKAGILSAALPESMGGAGLGLLEQCTVLAEIGRAVAPVPYLPTIVIGASALARFGTTGQQQRWAVPAARGELIIAAALAEEDADDPAAPSTRAEETGNGWLLSGTKTAVLAGAHAGLLLVPASTMTGPVVFLVAPDDEGVTITPQHVTGGDGTAVVELAGVHVRTDRLLGEAASGRQIARWVADRAIVGLCALQLGVAERALELTSGYAQRRQQFGKPIGSFQAVANRLADGFIDVEGIRLTLWQAAWRLDRGLPAETELATAKFWAADAGHRIAHTAVHVHGGVGIDTDGDVHRYFAAAKHNEFALGGATAQLRRLGTALAAG
jgi:3-oxocholest-4-en-26-oyl-CoA dehydrogenase beta subunit